MRNGERARMVSERDKDKNALAVKGGNVRRITYKRQQPSLLLSSSDKSKEVRSFEVVLVRSLALILRGGGNEKNDVCLSLSSSPDRGRCFDNQLKNHVTTFFKRERSRYTEQ